MVSFLLYLYFFIIIFSRNLFTFFLVDWLFMSLKFKMIFSSFVFSFILLLVTLRVLIFSSYYLDRELNFHYYFLVLMIFVLRIFMLNFSFNSFSILLSWDLLGISRFFLVQFYNNWDSCRGSINTVLTNRLGDYFIFIFFSVTIFSGISFFMFSIVFLSLFFFLLLAAFTKSAQFPFSGWLPKAIRAPTPVSSLVHRSTLVTAGLLLIFNFSFIMFNVSLIIIIFFIGLLTTFFSSLSAVVEEDLKKVVALRTLSQIGFSIFTFGLGVSFISLIHLLSHALFKSCLFIQVGYLIHCSFGQQDGRFYSFLGFTPFFIQLQLLVTLFCLCGLLFTRGLVSKDLILEIFYFNNYYFFVVILFFVTIYITFFYSYRLWKGLFINFSSTVYHFRCSFLINFLSLPLCLFSIFFIWWLNFNLIFIPSIFIYLDFFVPLIYVFLFLFLLYFSLKFLLKEFVYKFLADFLPKVSIYFIKNLKFVDLFFYNLSQKIIGLLIILNNFNLFFLYRNFFNSVVFLVFILFLII